MTKAQPETVGREGRPDGREAVLRMKIGGLSCSFCTNTIRTAYGRIDGVHEVGVSLAHEEGLIKYDPEKVTEEQLKQTLRDVGYTYRDPDKVRSFEEEAAEARRERNRLIVAGALTLTTFLLMLFGMWLNVVSIPLMPWVMLTLALETMFVTGWFIARMAYQAVRRRILNQHVLLEFAAFAGVAGGLLGIFVNPDFPAGDFFAVSVFVTTYHILSHYVSLIVRTRSSQAVRRLMDLQPAVARVIRDGQEVEVPIGEVVEDDRVRIRPGESVPVDGEVVEGVSAVNEALVTGEPIPTEKSPGDAVIGGSINQNGTLVVRVTRVGEESFLSQVARSIEQARALRPGVLVLVDIILPRYVRGVLIFAAFGFIAWTAGPLFFGEGPDWFRATFAALAALVLGYPCALGMAAPLAMIRGGGEAADRGILMRSGEAFQIMRDIRTVVLDKTGTITRGEPAVQVVIPAEGHTEADVLALAASAEASSEHPLARAVVEVAVERGAVIKPSGGFQAHAGWGVEATIEGERVLVGKPGFLIEQGVRLDGGGGDLFRREEEQGRTVIGVARAGEFLGVIAIADTIKEDARAAIRQMKDAGLRTVMLTGDNERAARAVAAAVGIDEVLAEALPEEKAAKVRELQREGQRVMMVGDGINDAPALTQSDVGIAIGAGTDIAIESADIVIMGDRLAAVMDAHEIGRRSYSKTKQNLLLAFAFNGIGVPAATTGLVHPVWAMIAMAASVTLVLTNSFAGRLVKRARGERAVSPPEAAKAAGVGEPVEERPASQAPVPHLALVLEPSAGPEPVRTGWVQETGETLLSVRMHCEGCEHRVESELGAMRGVRLVDADHVRGTVAVSHGPDVLEGQIRDRLRELGYHVDGHARPGDGKWDDDA